MMDERCNSCTVKRKEVKPRHVQIQQLQEKLTWTCVKNSTLIDNKNPPILVLNNIIANYTVPISEHKTICQIVLMLKSEHSVT